MDLKLTQEDERVISEKILPGFPEPSKRRMKFVHILPLWKLTNHGPFILTSKDSH